MTYWITNRDGEMFEDADASVMDAVLAELDGPARRWWRRRTHASSSWDREHPDVSLSHESEWTLSVYESGLVVWENVAEDNEPRHRHGVSRVEARRLWQELAEGDIAGVDAEEWHPGYG